MNKGIKNIIKVSLALGLGIIIIWLSLKNLTAIEKENIINSFKVADYYWIIFSILLGVIAHLTRAIRWKILLKTMGYNPSLYTSFLAVMIGYFANMGIPRSGELARCTILYKENKIPVDKSFGTVILERAIDMIFFFGLFFITIAIEYNRINNYVQNTIYPKIGEKFSFISTDHLFGRIGLFIALSLVVFYFIFRKKIHEWKFVQKLLQIFKGIFEGLKSISKIEKPLLFIFYSFMIWVFYFLMVYLTLFALPETSHLGIMAGLSVLVLGSIGIMITPGGIGLYPVIVSQTLMLYGITKISGIGLAMGYLTWSAQTIMILLVGGLSLLMVSFKSKKNGI